MKLVLVRHGQTASNITRALDTAMPGADLNEAGQAQVAAMAAQFEQLTQHVPSVITVSPLARTRATARALEERFHLTATVDQRVREVIAGELEMNTDDQSIRTYLSVIADWIHGNLERHMPGGETGWQTRRRICAAVNDVCHRAATQHERSHEEIGEPVAVVVAHGALCRVIAYSLAANITAPLVFTYPMANASTTVLDFSHHDTRRVCGEETPQWIDAENPQWRPWRALTWGDRPVDAWDMTHASDVALPSRLDTVR